MSEFENLKSFQFFSKDDTLMTTNKSTNFKTKQLKNAGYEVISGPRTTGDGYYESCIMALEGNQIEITV